MNVNTVSKTDCCGCTACQAVCPVGAIKMEADEEGFIYPVVTDKCIHCGLCYTTCTGKAMYNQSVRSAYAAKNTNKEVLKKSSSGGISNALCECVVLNGGIVYGVAYTDNFKVAVIRAETMQDCCAFYGSKYVQADPADSFSLVYEDLKNGKEVLFFGTSCVIAGLISFLKAKKCDVSQLYTIDIICHGVPSPKIFADYIHWLGKDLKTFEFRTKNKPWGYGSRNFGCTITTVKGGGQKKEVDTVKARVFLNLFFSNNCLRPHCHRCEFASIEKPSDISIADFWGLKDVHPDFFDEKGVSAVLIHSEKGERLFGRLKNVIYIQSTVENITKKQGNLNHASQIAPTRDDFWKLYMEKGFLAVAKKYGGWNIKYRWRKSKLYSRVHRKS